MALITINDITSYLNSTSDYTTGQIQSAIDWVEGFVQDYTGRKLEATEYFQWLDLNWENKIDLLDFPIISVIKIMNGTTNGINVNYIGTSKFPQISIADGYITLSDDTIENTIALGGTLQSFSNSIPASSDFVFTPETDCENIDSKYLLPMDSQLITTQYNLLIPNSPVQTRRIERQNGVIDLGYEGNGLYFIHYNAGYSTIPASLKQILIEMVVTSLSTIGIDYTLKTEKFSKYSYERFGASEVYSQFHPRLDFYKMVFI